MKKILLSFLLINSINNEICSLSYKASNVFSGLVAATSGLTSKYLQEYYNDNLCPLYMPELSQKSILKTSLFVSLVTGFLAKIWSKQYTPAPLLDSVKKNIERQKQYLIFDFVFNKNFEGQSLLTAIENSSVLYPLANFFCDLNVINFESFQNIKYLEMIIRTVDAQEDVKEEAMQLLAEFNQKYFDKIEKAMCTIKNHPSFYIQKATHDQSLSNDQLRFMSKILTISALILILKPSTFIIAPNIF